MADAASFRAEGDKRLYAELLADGRVREAIEVVKSSALEGHVPAVRRALLARSLRLPPSVQPELHAIVASCRERLGVSEPVECYVNPSSEYNAGIFPRQDGRLYILFTAALLEAFDRDELRFVVGHELGHHVYGHHEIPIAVLFDQRFPTSPELALRLTAWQRYAEISADRAWRRVLRELRWRRARALQARVGAPPGADERANRRLPRAGEGARRCGRRNGARPSRGMVQLAPVQVRSACRPRISSAARSSCASPASPRRGSRPESPHSWR
jgi:hypothetical protein